MPFWSGETLLAKLPQLVSEFAPTRVDCAAYTLRMGAEAYVSPSEAEQDPDKITIQKLASDQSFTIPPGQFAFLLTEESVTVPRDAIGFISMKSRIKLRGLVNVSGFHVDPGYTGRLIFAVFNAGPKVIHLRRGEECFLIWFADLDNKESNRVKEGTGYHAITTEIISKLSGEMMSFEGLNAKIRDLRKDYDKRIHKIERDHGVIKALGTLAIGILIAVVLQPYIRDAWQSLRQAPALTSAPSAPPQPR
jgi:dCTP deaminase